MNHEGRIHGDMGLRDPVGCCAKPRKADRVGTGSLAEGIFFASAVAALLLWRETPFFGTLAVTFVAIVLEALPFMLAGSLIGGFIETFVSQQRMSRLVPAGRHGVFLAAGLGLVFPICECAVVPIVRRLLGKGVSPAAAVAYLLAGPIANPIVFISTGTAYSFQWSTAFTRLICGYAVGAFAGLFLERVFGTGFRAAMLRQDRSAEAGVPSCGCAEEHVHESACGAFPTGTKRRILGALFHGSEDFLETGRFLIIGAFVAAIAQTVVPRELLAAPGGSPVPAILSAMAMAVGLNLCSEADAFVAASMRSMWPFGAQMAFMLLGPMLDMKLLFMYRALFKGPFIAVLASTMAICVFLVSLGIHFLFKGVTGG